MPGTATLLGTGSVSNAFVTGVLHPGAMGATVAAACSGTVLWAGEGRSAATRTRADEAGLTDVGDIRSMAAAAEPRAWRWTGEMDEIAATFAEAGLPDGFHRAAGEVYERLRAFKDAPGTTVDEMLEALLR